MKFYPKRKRLPVNVTDSISSRIVEDIGFEDIVPDKLLKENKEFVLYRMTDGSLIIEDKKTGESIELQNKKNLINLIGVLAKIKEDKIFV